ncbi:MAG TPA: Ig-like domain-containing protein, partial [Acidimicrobiales bacterium]|nr:Ig-like domain-containing protein [Acidimicrobiales bacterium]
LAMTIFAIVGSALVGVILLWFTTSQATTNEASLSSDSQVLVRYFVPDVSSVSLPYAPPNPYCVPFTDTYSRLTWGGALPGTPAAPNYEAEYVVVPGLTLNRLLLTTIAGKTVTTTVAVVNHLKAGTTPCITTQGLTLTITVTTALAGAGDYTYSVTGDGRSSFDASSLGITLTTPANSGATHFTMPMFAGTASTGGSPTITLRIYSGTGTGGTLVQTLTTTASAGAWSATPTTALAANATYTAQASQSDTAGDTVVSSANAFVLDTIAPTITLTAPANSRATSNTTPGFSGAAGTAAASATTSADMTVIVSVYSGTGTGGTLVQTLTTMASAGAWSVTPTTALAANATYTAQASQSDAAGNTGVSSANTFTVSPSNGVTVTPSTTNSSYYSGQDLLSFKNVYSITALSITVQVAQTTGVAFNSQSDSFPHADLAPSHTTSGAVITYTYLLNPGYTISAMYSGGIAQSQFSGTGAARVTSGDTWSVTSTSNGITSTLSGTF